jgi:hypothetical protein
MDSNEPHPGRVKLRDPVVSSSICRRRVTSPIFHKRRYLDRGDANAGNVPPSSTISNHKNRTVKAVLAFMRTALDIELAFRDRNKEEQTNGRTRERTGTRT